MCTRGKISSTNPTFPRNGEDQLGFNRQKMSISLNNLYLSTLVTLCRGRFGGETFFFFKFAILLHRDIPRRRGTRTLCLPAPHPGPEYRFREGAWIRRHIGRFGGEMGFYKFAIPPHRDIPRRRGTRTLCPPAPHPGPEYRLREGAWIRQWARPRRLKRWLPLSLVFAAARCRRRLRCILGWARLQQRKGKHQKRIRLKDMRDDSSGIFAIE